MNKLNRLIKEVNQCINLEDVEKYNMFNEIMGGDASELWDFDDNGLTLTKFGAQEVLKMVRGLQKFK